jgi:methionine-rich copper-binding protein CopC
MARRLLIHASTAAILFCLFLAAVPAAFAHAHPVTMTPAKDSTVTAPTEISVFFSEALEPKFSTLQLQDSMGMVVSKATAVIDPKDAKHLTLALPTLAPGVYTVNWVSVATDGHRMPGKYSFTVTAKH